MVENYKSPLIFFTCIFVFVTKFLGTEQKSIVEVNVGVVLDFEMLPTPSVMGLNCLTMALSDFYASHSHYNTRVVLHIRDSKGDEVGAAAAALYLIKNVEVEAIFGPLTSMQAKFLIDLGDKAEVPIISFTATSPSLTSVPSPYFFRIAQNDSAQVQAISAIVKAFGWRQVVPIYVDNEFGEGIIPYLSDALQEVDARIPYRSVVPPSASDDQIYTELYKLMTMQTRVFVVHMYPDLSSRLFVKAKEIGMMNEGYVWIVTDAITNVMNSIHPSVFDSMQGVLGVKTYVPRSLELDNFLARWKKKFRQENSTVENPELDVFGLWGYDAAWALALAVETIGTPTKFHYQSLNASNNVTDLETFGVSENGPKIRDALASVTFKGLAGEFILIKGQLKSPFFQIVNVNGEGVRGIGFWTPQTGLTKVLNSTKTSAYSTSKKNLGTIIWPGDPTEVPKGWEIPTKDKKLRIGVPVKNGFTEFVKVTHDSDTNETEVSGYSIDVFKAVLDELPYTISYEFIPFAKPNGGAAGSYSDMINQVYLGKFDAVVGDTTIVSKRAENVDFTLPYTESGVIMVVPIEDKSEKNAWVFLKPLTWDLWLTTALSVLSIALLVWFLEHRINDDFRGPLSSQIGTSLWFSFSTMVFAHKEMVYSNWTRFVVVVWFLLVLILTQSYTASLASLLTVQQLQPTVTDLNELIKNGHYVGCKNTSFVPGILTSVKLDSSKLISYSSAEELDELFTKGSGNGGISAAFDEIPYMKLFLSKYCSKYTSMRDPSYKTDGFGFAFPIGSPLVGDISRAILKVTEGEKMKQIEDKWFGKFINCPSSTTSINFTSLSMKSFWFLFAMAGVASLIAIIGFAISFIKNEKDNLKREIKLEDPITKRLRKVLKIYDDEDTKFHKKRDVMTRLAQLELAFGTMAATSGQMPTNPSSTPCSIPVQMGDDQQITNYSFSDQGEPSRIGESSPTPLLQHHIDDSE